MDWFEKMLMDAAHVLSGLTGLLTLGLWRPMWTIDVTLWSLHRQAKRAEESWAREAHDGR